jgi:hypothetical protein
MTTAAIAQRPARSLTPAARTDFASLIQTGGSKLPNRYVLYAGPGWGKTSLAAQMPHPLFLQMRGETGLESLIDAGQLNDTPHLPEITTWANLLDALDWIRSAEHNYKTLVIDALNGTERLCHENVCERDFTGDWTDKGFMGYMRGYEVSLADWRLFLGQLDAIRLERKMTIMLLNHAKVVTFKNPDGPDFDRYQPDMHPKTWALTDKWADCVLFGNFEAQLEQVTENRKTGAKKGKFISRDRVLCTESQGAYDAKNRLGLPPEIEMGKSPQEAWGAMRNAIVAARKQPQPAAEGGVQ